MRLAETRKKRDKKNTGNPEMEGASVALVDG